MLSVSQRNWFFRWAYLINFQDTRNDVEVTTLCSLFWRSVFLTPLKLALFSAPAVGVGYWVGVTPLGEVAKVIGFLAVVVAWFCLGHWLDKRDTARKERERREGTVRQPSFLHEAYRGIKERYCPLVRVVR